MPPQSSSAGGHLRQRKPPAEGRSKAAAGQPAANRFDGGGWRIAKVAVAVVAVTAAALVAVLFRSAGGGGHPAVTPFAAPKVTELEALGGAHEQRMLWGSYRPGYYFGMRTRRPAGLLAGLMWWDPQRPDFFHNIRHEAQERDGLAKFGWLQHDGASYGHQELLDMDYNITTTMVKRAEGGEGAGAGGDWAVRVSCSRLEGADPPDGVGSEEAEKRQATFLVYLAEEGEGLGGRRGWSMLPQGPKAAQGGLTLATGSSAEVGGWALHLADASRSVKSVTFLGERTPHMHNLTDLVKRHLRQAPAPRRSKPGAMPKVVLSGHAEPGANVMVFQVTATLPLSFTAVFVGGISEEGGASECLWGAPGGRNRCQERAAQLSGEPLRAEIAQRSAAFERRFAAFLGRDVGPHHAVARAALSNMLGGMGYFYGSSLVGLPNGSGGEAIVESWDAPLFTAVPSRAFFPRGFLWDEGFHHLLISRWDPVLTADSLAHWLDLISAEGWIPREQIRGAEAQSRVPGEFITQRPSAANPPTLFLPILRMARHVAAADPQALVDDPALATQKAFLEAAFPRLEKWFLWFNATQAGDAPGSYRWRGRDAATDAELNPKTLTSGLDDFPRASHPSRQERHVDLRCWMSLAARALATIGQLAGLPASKTAVYEATAARLEDYAQLKQLHHDAASGLYLDWGNHTEAAQLRWSTRMDERGQLQRVMLRATTQRPAPMFVPHAGYVSLFPFLMKLIPPAANELSTQLWLMSDPAQLWTDFGLRSLSASSSLYGKRNTEHDAPYWRGAIWININYLALGALKHYAEQPGPHAAAAGALYLNLREALLSNIAAQYERTGYLWEQYGDADGGGKGCRPFTGWTGLVALIAAEIYD